MSDTWIDRFDAVMEAFEAHTEGGERYALPCAPPRDWIDVTCTRCSKPVGSLRLFPGTTAMQVSFECPCGGMTTWRSR